MSADLVTEGDGWDVRFVGSPEESIERDKELKALRLLAELKATITGREMSEREKQILYPPGAQTAIVVNDVERLLPEYTEVVQAMASGTLHFVLDGDHRGRLAMITDVREALAYWEASPEKSPTSTVLWFKDEIETKDN